MKNLKQLLRNELKKINGGDDTDKMPDGGTTGCKECKTCSNGLHSCVTMPTCEEASRILNNLC